MHELGEHGLRGQKVQDHVTPACSSAARFSASGIAAAEDKARGIVWLLLCVNLAMSCDIWQRPSMM